jgi:hypothetical protein
MSLTESGFLEAELHIARYLHNPFLCWDPRARVAAGFVAQYAGIAVMGRAYEESYSYGIIHGLEPAAQYGPVPSCETCNMCELLCRIPAIAG